MPYSGGVVRACVALGLVLAAVPARARADGVAIVGGSPRAIGRAGASVVGDDGGGALLVNPAAIARRDSTRVQVGVALVDDATSWDPDHPGGPIARDQAGSRLQPIAAVVTGVRGWVIGVGVMTAGITERALRDPSDVPVAANLGAQFEYRYAGIAGELRRDTVALGAARRIGDAAAVGLAVGLSRVTMGETRRVWAGFAGITEIGDPSRDVELALAGTDERVPSVTAGVLIAPTESPMELAASVAWTQRTELDGTASAAGVMGGPVVRLSSPRSTLAFRQPLAVRAGVRYLGDRFVAEVGGDLWISPRSTRATAWQVEGVQVVDPSTVSVAPATVPSRLSLRTHGAVRGAVDVELIAGFLWATAGYAYTVGSTTQARLSPTLAALGGHTLALGVEGTAGGFTYTIGWSRTLSTARRGGEAFALDNPFGAGDGAVPGGTYDGSADQLGVLLDVELDGP